MQTYVPPPTAPKRRGMKIGKKLGMVNAEFQSLPREHKKPTVYFALGRAAGIKDETLRKHAGVYIALLEGAG